MLLTLAIFCYGLGMNIGVGWVFSQKTTIQLSLVFYMKNTEPQGSTVFLFFLFFLFFILFYFIKI